MFNFENLHKNKKLAFLDGLLCGVVITGIGMAIYQQYKESRELYTNVEETDQNSKTNS